MVYHIMYRVGAKWVHSGIGRCCQLPEMRTWTGVASTSAAKRSTPDLILSRGLRKMITLKSWGEDKTLPTGARSRATSGSTYRISMFQMAAEAVASNLAFPTIIICYRAFRVLLKQTPRNAALAIVHIALLLHSHSMDRDPSSINHPTDSRASSADFCASPSSKPATLGLVRRANHSCYIGSATSS